MTRYLIIMIVLLLVFTAQVSLSGDGRRIQSVAVLTFENLTGEDLPCDLTQVVCDHLEKKKFEIISEEVLEGFFVARRIRRTGLLSRTTIRDLGERLKADVLITGSVNLLSDGDNPRVDVSAQMIDTLDSSICWINSVSYSGDDFATFFRIGEITSLEKLVTISVQDLLKDIPEVFEEKKEKKGEMGPFEIARAGFYPQAAKPGESVELVIEVMEISGMPTYINAIVFDKSVSLVSEGDGWYRGTFFSPATEGIYTLKIYAAAELNKVFFFDDLASLVVDNTPPVVAIEGRGTLISPNGDGINDYAMFFPVLLKTDILKDWRFEIRDRTGKLIRSDEGPAGLPKTLIWRGKNDDFKPVDDGAYWGQLIINDKAGHEATTKKVMISVDRTLPDIEIVLCKITEDFIVFSVECNEASKIVEWDILIYDQGGKCVKKLGGEQDLPSDIQLQVKNKGDSLNRNGFSYSSEVRDAAGNMLTVEKEPVKSAIPERTPAQTEQEEWIDDF